MQADFNEEPFDLGSYAEIANYRGGKAGRAKTFEIGFRLHLDESLPKSNSAPEAQVIATFKQAGASPEPCKLSIMKGELGVLIELLDDHENVEITVITQSGRKKLEIEGNGSRVLLALINSTTPLNILTSIFDRENQIFSFKFSGIDADEGKLLVEMMRSIFPRSRPSTVVALAPVRTKPERTYNQRKATFAPEGAHVPMHLARVFHRDKAEWVRLREQLNVFGAASGLFGDIAIRPLGRGETDPFQIRVRINGPQTNLVDVGYGVSQILPILYDLFTDNARKTYLLQQPEVHLHPKAQAQLGSLLSSLAKDKKMSFVVETHSDHLLDRIRMEMRGGRGPKAEDLSILFFERKNSGVEIHRIVTDDDGNIVSAPPAYRKFFLQEERRMIGI